MNDVAFFLFDKLYYPTSVYDLLAQYSVIENYFESNGFSNFGSSSSGNNNFNNNILQFRTAIEFSVFFHE